MHRVAIAASIVAALLPTAASAQLATPAPRSIDQGLIAPASSAATSVGAEATSVNPAGLGYLDGAEVDYLHQRLVLSNQVADGVYGGVGIGYVSVGASLEWVRTGNGPNYRRDGLALALGVPELTFGVAYHALSSDDAPGLDGLSGWDLGVVLRPFRSISLGFSVQDVDTPRLVSNQALLVTCGVACQPGNLPRRYDVGLAIRPIHEWLTLSADWLVDDNGGLNGASLSYGAGIRLIDGLTVLGQVAHYYNQGIFAATAGLVLDTPHFGVGYAASTDNTAAGVNHSVGARLSTARHRDVRLGMARFAVLDLAALLTPPSGIDAVLDTSGADPYVSLLQLMRRAKLDPDIQGVILKISNPDGLGMAHVQELRQAVTAIHSVGKPVIAVLGDAGDAEYFLASACDKIYALPEGALLINGLATNTQFFGDLLTRLGIHVDVVRVGAFKNAPDQLTRGDMSDEQREAMDAYLNTVFSEYVATVSKERKLSPERFRQILDKGIMPPDEAVKLGLLDKVVFQEDLPGLAGALVGVNSATLIDGYAGWDFAPERWGGMPKLALIRIEGTIVEGNSSSGQFGFGGGTGADTIVQGIEEAVGDDDVKAIVLRVDSPGGSGSASDLIYRAVMKAREKKPVVVSMGNYAASGGYYVAIAGDTIWCEPTTLTGSIGVFAIHPDASGLLHKVSVGTVTMKRGEMADIFQFDHTWSDPERETMQGWVDQFYDGFITLVSERRKIDKSAVDRIARGRIWSGSDAKERGLVDQLGSLEDAIADAKARAHLEGDDRVSLETFGNPKSLFPLSLADAFVGSEVKSALAPLGLVGLSQAAINGIQLAQMRGPVAAIPYSVDVK